MHVVYPRCCGLDVHEASIGACILIHGPGGKERYLRRFGTRTDDIAELDFRFEFSALPVDAP